MELTGIKKPSAYLRKMAMDGYVLKMDLTDLKEMVRLEHINANNLNQFVKRANETGNIYETDIESLRRNQEEILKMLREMYEKLSKIK